MLTIKRYKFINWPHIDTIFVLNGRFFEIVLF